MSHGFTGRAGRPVNRILRHAGDQQAIGGLGPAARGISKPSVGWILRHVEVGEPRWADVQQAAGLPVSRMPQEASGLVSRPTNRAPESATSRSWNPSRR